MWEEYTSTVIRTDTADSLNDDMMHDRIPGLDTSLFRHRTRYPARRHDAHFRTFVATRFLMGFCFPLLVRYCV